MTGKRRAQRRALGSVFERKDGRWVAMLDLGLVAGKRKRLQRYAPDRKAAEKLLSTMIQDQEKGEVSADRETTLTDWMDRYLTRKERDWAQSTAQEYRRLSKLMTEQVGKVRLHRLTPLALQDALEGLTHQHRTRLKVATLFRTALEEAVNMGLVGKNPAAMLTVQRRPTAAKGQAYSEDEVRRLLAVTVKRRNHALYLLALTLGVRIGELLALTVADYDPEAGNLTIRGSLQGGSFRSETGEGKTTNAKRTLPLTRDQRAALDAQLAQNAREREKGGDTYIKNTWLFPSDMGTLTSYRVTVRSLRARQEAAGVAALRWHDLRHTFITLALRRGVPVEVVSRLVGHSSPLITLKIYRQVQAVDISSAVAKLEGLLDLPTPAPEVQATTPPTDETAQEE